MLKFAVGLIALVMALPAGAQVMDEKSARKMLFSTRGYTVQVSSQLSAGDAATIQALVPLMAQQMGQPVRYFTSIAFAPDEGLVSDSLQGALNHHTIAAADAAAIRACNAAKKGSSGPCQLAGRVVPKKYGQRPFTLSMGATEGFTKTYRREKSPKAFAISPSTGAFGVGKSDQGAIIACADDAGGAQDCRVVIRD